ncbi:hypothetical protein GQ457_11G030680 [Hibiscus cannabinus]
MLILCFNVKKQGKPVWVVRTRNWKLRGGENRLSGLLEGVSIVSSGRQGSKGDRTYGLDSGIPRVTISGRSCDWTGSRGLQVSPIEGVLKFNVDGAARGKPGLAVCGGVLRNWESLILALFFGPIGVADSNEAELQAIGHALALLAEIDLQGIHLVVIESDSRVAVSWVLQRERRPWQFWHWFSIIDEVCEILPNICFHTIYREANSVAAVLAKNGIDRRSWLRVL